MCGCNGEYKTEDRPRKLAITQLLKNPAVKYHTWNNDQEGCIFVETPTRNRVLYLNNKGIQAVRALGVPETEK
jgi:hypothetical protein